MPPTNSKPITLPDGSQAFGIEVDFDTVREEWNVYTTSEGARLRLKTTLIRAYRIVDAEGKQLYEPDGQLQYFVNTGMVVVVRDKVEGER